MQTTKDIINIGQDVGKALIYWRCSKITEIHYFKAEYVFTSSALPSLKTIKCGGIASGIGSIFKIDATDEFDILGKERPP